MCMGTLGMSLVPFRAQSDKSPRLLSVLNSCCIRLYMTINRVSPTSENQDVPYVVNGEYGGLVSRSSYLSNCRSFRHKRADVVVATRRLRCERSSMRCTAVISHARGTTMFGWHEGVGSLFGSKGVRRAVPKAGLDTV